MLLEINKKHPLVIDMHALVHQVALERVDDSLASATGLDPQLVRLKNGGSLGVEQRGHALAHQTSVDLTNCYGSDATVLFLESKQPGATEGRLTRQVKLARSDDVAEVG